MQKVSLKRQPKERIRARAKERRRERTKEKEKARTAIASHQTTPLLCSTRPPYSIPPLFSSSTARIATIRVRSPLPSPKLSRSIKRMRQSLVPQMLRLQRLIVWKTEDSGGNESLIISSLDLATSESRAPGRG